MFGDIRRLVGNIGVREVDDLILVEGVPGYFIESDIAKIWKTSRISSGMFEKITRNSFSFHKFFTIDIVYILEELTKNRRVGAGNARTAKKILDALYENTWLKKTKSTSTRNLNFSKLDLFYKKPLDFQQAFYDKYNRVTEQYSLKGYLLNGSPGSGKTLMSLSLAEMLGADKVIVVCPINAVYRVWKESLENEYRTPPTYWIVGENKAYENQKYLICHYEALKKLLEGAKGLTGKIMVVLDESHNMNEMASMQTNLFIKLCSQYPNADVLWASGTPIKALGSESIPLMLTIDPFFTPQVVESYKKIYGKDATKAIDILSNRIQLVSHVIEKAQLNLQPPIIETFKVTVPNGDQFTLDSVKTEMTEFVKERNRHYQSIAGESEEFFKKCIEHCKQLFSLNTTKYRQEVMDLNRYNQYVSLIRSTTDYAFVKNEMKFCSDYEKNTIIPLLPAEWKDKFRDVKSVIKYVKLKIQGECLGRVLGKRRMESVKAVCENIDYIKYIESTQKKTLIFTSYVEVLERCRDKLSELGQKPLAVYAKTNKDLNDIIENFGKDKELNPLVATYPSLSTAVPLTMADVMIMINPPFRDYIHQQAISRIHRLGSTTQVYVWIASLDTGNKPNLSSRTIDILKWSQDQVAAITGVKSPFEVDDKPVAIEGIDDNFIDDFMYKDVGLEEMFLEPVFEEKQVQKPVFGNW